MDKQKSQAFMLKVVSDLAAGLAVSMVHVGDRVGLFKAMAGAGPLTSDALASRTGILARYVEEWLAAMYCAGYLDHDADAMTWSLPDEHAVYLGNDASEYYLGGLFKGVPAMAAMAPSVARAFETGQGISFQDYGDGTPLALEQMNRNVYEARLVKVWLPAMPQVVDALQRGGTAIDIGCGTGVVPILLAQAFPAARVSGLDFDPLSIELARANAQRAGVDAQVSFLCQSATDLAPPGDGFDFICSFDCLHDVGEPERVLRRMREALAADGTVLLVEPRVSDRLAEDASNPFARMLHGISCLHCVPQSLSQGGPGLGACWGERRAATMARQAGFTRFTPLPVRSPVQAFYELRA
jgi:SAM-dependent methyltransferase